METALNNRTGEETPKQQQQDAASFGRLSAPPHTLGSDEVIKAYATNPETGLSEDQARKYMEEFGPNKLKEVPPPSFLSILIRNTLNAMTIVLIAAMAVSFGTQDFISGGVIAALVVINVGVGTINEYKAEKTVAALEAIGSPTATVLRDRQTKVVQTDEVVPGDIVLVKIGDIVPADCRVIPEFLAGLECDEALLTGESLPSVKTTEPISDPVCPVGDRTCMIYSGSQAVKGRVRAVCVATGMQSELGKISEAMNRKAESNKKGFAARWHKVKAFLGVVDTTPLQIKLNKLAYVILFFACIVAVIVVSSTGYEFVPLSIATYAVAAAVSLLPASLPAVIALSLATASRKLAESNALVRKMDAIETLAAVTDVCSDKTGTITLGKMVMKKAWVPARTVARDGDSEDTSVEVQMKDGQYFAVETGSDPYYPRGRVTAIETANDASDDSDSEGSDSEENVVDIHNLEKPLRDFTLCASLCSSATLQRAKDDNGKLKWEGHGDATEVALQTYCYKVGHGRPHLTHSDLKKTNSKPDKPGMERVVSNVSEHHRVPKAKTTGHYEFLVEHAFDSSIKRMTMAYTYHPGPDSSEEPHVLVVMKGAFERVASCCDGILLSKSEGFDESKQAMIQEHYDSLASQGLRVLTLVGKTAPMKEAEAIKAMTREDLETGMNFLGLAGIYDPPRPESAGAVADLHSASIIPRMLTGDHKATAVAIAQQVGIIGKDYSKNTVMTGPEFDKLSIEEIDSLDQLPRVVARCAPETKVRMVEAIHRRSRLTVMTGDGVNDAPSLKRADVGVAMGLNGSDVAKQSAEMVLSDDRFSTIVTAIQKGRGIFSNLSKFFLYLMSGNVAQIMLMLIGLAFIDDQGLSTFPTSPVAILWINTLCAGPPALALGLEPTPRDAMSKRPEDYKTIFTFWWIVDLFTYGTFMAGIALANFSIVMYGYFGGDLGVNCNEDLTEGVCSPTGRARGAVFATFLMVLMLHGFVCKHATMSLFKMNLLENKVLLASVAIISLSVFPVLYIPVINDKVFLLFGLKWEWGMVFASLLVYIAFTEAYKLLRRRVERRTEAKRAAADAARPSGEPAAAQAEKEKVKNRGENSV